MPFPATANSSIGDSRRHRLNKALALSAIAALCSCSNIRSGAQTAISSVLPQDVASRASLQSVALHSNVIKADVSNGLTGSSPDGSYVIRTLHDKNAKMHLANHFKSTTAPFTQVEYTTPIGPMVVIQAKKRPVDATVLARAQAAAQSQDPKALDYATLATGKSSHGADWVIAEDNKSKGVLVHAEFSDSTIDVTLPAGTQVSTIRPFMEELY